MKQLILFFSTLVLISCDTEDRNFYNSIYVTSPTPVIKVEATASQYNVGDFVYVNTDDFNNVITEPGQSTPLNIFKTTNSTFMLYFFYLEKNVNGEWTRVIVSSNNLDVDSGTANLTETINVMAFYNELTDKFDSRIGVKIESPGQYRLIFQESIQTSNHIQLSSPSVNGFTAVIISSKLQFGTGNSYNFTVL